MIYFGSTVTRLLRRHVARRTENTALAVPAVGAHRRQSPIRDQHLSKRTDHDVFRLQGPVNESAGLRKVHRLSTALQQATGRRPDRAGAVVRDSLSRHLPHSVTNPAAGP